VSRDDRGSVTPLAIAGIGLIVVVSLLVSVVGGGLVTLRRSQAAADLAALAGAVAFQHGADACSAAARSARLNGARLAECLVNGQVVAVRVTLEAPRMFGRELELRAYARAGPR
jgi:secretion/DNA translocation related TadE-like protein